MESASLGQSLKNGILSILLAFSVISGITSPQSASAGSVSYELSKAPACLVSLSEIWSPYGNPFPCFLNGTKITLDIPRVKSVTSQIILSVNSEQITIQPGTQIEITNVIVGLNEVRVMQKKINGTLIDIQNPLYFIIYENNANLLSVSSVEEKKSYVIVHKNLNIQNLLQTLSIQKNEILELNTAFEMSGNKVIVLDLNQAQFDLIRKNPQVLYISPQFIVNKNSVQTNPPSWGLDRIDQEALPLDSSYETTFSGNGVNAYVIDTGINTNHSQFTGRIPKGWYGSSFTTYEDCDGHGTHVSGTIGGSTYGVAKNVKLIPVRALDCLGSGSWSDVMSGITWIIADHNTNQPAVVNMSIGGGYYQSLNDAVQLMINDGLVVVVAAGNDGSDACFSSPSSAPNAITVGASTIDDQDAWFSNIGSCVDIFAPGLDITSAYIGSSTSSAVLSGTSMASPHVAGAAALVLERDFSSYSNKLNANSEVLNSLITNSSKNLLSPCCGGMNWWNATVNALLNISFLNTNSLLPQTISFNPPSSLGGNQFPFTLSASSSSGLPVTLVSNSPSVCEVNNRTLTMLNSGSCTLVSSQEGNETYSAAASITRTINLVKSNQVLTFNTPARLGGNQFPYTLNANSSSNLPITFVSLTPSICGTSLNVLTMLNSGLCRVTASQSGNNLFNAALSVTRNITLSKASQSISFSPPASMTANQFPYTLVATASSGLTTTIVSRTTRVCIVESNTTLIRVRAGRCTLAASQLGNAVFNAAPTVTRNIQFR